MFHPWYPETLASHNVIDLRLWKMAHGRTGGTPGELMVKEKVDVLFEAQRGGSAQIIDMYRRRVATNTSRPQVGSATS